MLSVQLGPRAGRASLATRDALGDSGDAHRHRADVETARSGPIPFDVDRYALGLPRGRADLMARVVVNVPAQAKRGEVIEIRTLAGHPMETGFRRTQLGEVIPRDIIRTLVCTYNGVEVFRAELHPAIAANPLLTFTTVATESGTLEFRWSGDNGFSATEKAAIKVV